MRWFATLTEPGMFGNNIMEAVRTIRGYPTLAELKAFAEKWRTPQGQCCRCRNNAYPRLLPFAIRDYQDSTEYGFCSWSCLKFYAIDGPNNEELFK